MDSSENGSLETKAEKCSFGDKGRRLNLKRRLMLGWPKLQFMASEFVCAGAVMELCVLGLWRLVIDH